MAQDQSLTTGSNRLRPVRKVHREELDSSRLQTDVAEALFEVHRLEAIVEDLAIVVARVGRLTVGTGDIEDRLDHLERTFGT
jgi:histone H3/H4